MSRIPDMMDDETLLLKYQALLAENKALKEENLSLKAKLGLPESVESRTCPGGPHQDVSRTEISCQNHANSDSMKKIRLFMSLFKGRDDL